MQALNRSVKHHLPQGADALAWHRVMNEAQMILHTHPVNVAREANGLYRRCQQYPGYGVGGILPAMSPPPYTDT